MSQKWGRKRLEPSMTRGGWRFAVWSFGLQAVCLSMLAFLSMSAGNGWDVAGFWLFTVAALLSAIYFLHLLRVRRHDAPFWDEEEARRADWDRRGRQL